VNRPLEIASRACASPAIRPAAPRTRRLRLIAVVFTLSAAGLLVTGPAAEAQLQPQPCAPFKPCTPVVGPWVTAPPELDEIWEVDCPQATPNAVGADATFQGAIYPIALVTGGESPAPGFKELTFSVFPVNASITFQPSAGCAPARATLASFRQAAPDERTYRTRVRQRPIQPGGAVRLRLGCRPGERLVDSGSAVGFFTKRAPSPRVARSLEHRHLRTRTFARTFVRAPATVGDDERVEVRLTTFCSPARQGAAEDARSAQSFACAQWTPCTAVTGPWVTTPSDGDGTYYLECPAGTVGVGSDAAFPGEVEPVGIGSEAACSPGGSAASTSACWRPRRASPTSPSSAARRRARPCSPPGWRRPPPRGRGGSTGRGGCGRASRCECASGARPGGVWCIRGRASPSSPSDRRRAGSSGRCGIGIAAAVRCRGPSSPHRGAWERRAGDGAGDGGLLGSIGETARPVPWRRWV
jgi:hypothetical protein